MVTVYVLDPNQLVLSKLPERLDHPNLKKNIIQKIRLYGEEYEKPGPFGALRAETMKLTLKSTVPMRNPKHQLKLECQTSLTCLRFVLKVRAISGTKGRHISTKLSL